MIDHTIILIILHLVTNHMQFIVISFPTIFAVYQPPHKYSTRLTQSESTISMQQKGQHVGVLMNLQGTAPAFPKEQMSPHHFGSNYIRNMQEIKIGHVTSGRKEVQFTTLMILQYLANMTNLCYQFMEAPVAPTNIAVPGPTAAIWHTVKKTTPGPKEIKELQQINKKKNNKEHKKQEEDMKHKKDEAENANKAAMDKEKTCKLDIIEKNLHNIMNRTDEEEIVDMELEEEEEEEERSPTKKQGESSKSSTK
jgi:hypothetical protein